MRVTYCPYELKGRAPFGDRTGALLRWEWPDGKVGYSDCHPWPELGDAALDQQLSLLKEGTLTTLTTRSHYFAAIDAEAREANTSLFADFSSPSNHWLVCDLSESIPEGFKRVKVKVGRDPSHELPKLKRLFYKLPDGVKVRLDFNARLDKGGFLQYMESISLYHDQIEFIEDPFPYDPSEWSQVQQSFAISLACDFESEKTINEKDSHQIHVIKPAVQDVFPFMNDKARKWVVTSYLDHPLGQLAAAYVAGQLAKEPTNQLLTCGLLSHTVYQTNEFSEQLSVEGDRLIVPKDGTGFGFDDLFYTLEWRPLP